MANDYYSVTYDFAPFTRVVSSQVDEELAAIVAGFDKLPSLSQTRSANTSFVAAGGTANAITVAHPINTWSSYTGKDGHRLCIQITTENTGATTLNVDGLGTKTCLRNDGSALQAGDLQANGFYDFVYDESNGNFKVVEAINGVLTDAETEASNAATSASNAATSESNAASSASAASTSESNAATSESNASTSATKSENYAVKDDGYASGTDNSSKSWAIGGTGDGDPTAGAAKDWAVKTDGYVSGTDNSAKSWSVGGTGDGDPAAGSAKDWAITAEDTLVDGAEYSSKHYAAKAAASAETAGDNVAGQINAATSKTTPVNADELALADSAASYDLKKLTWANLKTTAWAGFEGLNQTWTGHHTFKEISATVYSVSGTTPALDPGNGEIQLWTLSGNSSPTDALTDGQAIILMVNDGTGYTITWPTMTWLTSDGTAPVLNTSGYTAFVLWKASGTLYGRGVNPG